MQREGGGDRPLEQGEVGEGVVIAAAAHGPPQLGGHEGEQLALGATLIAPERPTPFERFFFRDPDGYVFEVVAAERGPEG